MVYLGDVVTIETHHRVLKLVRLLESRPLSHIRNLHPGYFSLLVVFDPVRQNHKRIEGFLRTYIEELDDLPLPETSTVEIPVCYGGEYGPDLDELAAIHEISPERVIEVHSSAEYIVYFMGFVPGFAHLGGLPPELATPRLPSPRQAVPTGSVAIGGGHTGIYPMETPGGWRLIGKTPVPIFDRKLPKLSRLSIGDKVRFKPVPHDQFAVLQRQSQ